MIASISRILLVTSIIYSAFIATTIFYRKNTIDPQFKPYYNEYMTLLKAHCDESQYVVPRSLEIEFADLDYPEIGVCKYNRLGHHIIQIDRTFWKFANDDSRFNLASHEQSHCALHIGHSPNPQSYMYASINFLIKAEVVRQVNELLKERCGR